MRHLTFVRNLDDIMILPYMASGLLLFMTVFVVPADQLSGHHYFQGALCKILDYARP